MPSREQTTCRPRGGRAACGTSARPFSITTAASIRWRSTSSHCAAVADPGVVVARRVEVVGRAAVGRARAGARRPVRPPSGSRTRAALRAAPASSRRCGAETRICSREKSSLVRPMVNSTTSKLPPCFTTASKISVISRESMRWPSVWTISVTGVSCSREVRRVVGMDPDKKRAGPAMPALPCSLQRC